MEGSAWVNDAVAVVVPPPTPVNKLDVELADVDWVPVGVSQSSLCSIFQKRKTKEGVG